MRFLADYFLECVDSTLFHHRFNRAWTRATRTGLDSAVMQSNVEAFQEKSEKLLESWKNDKSGAVSKFLALGLLCKNSQKETPESAAELFAFFDAAIEASRNNIDQWEDDAFPGHYATLVRQAEMFSEWYHTQDARLQVIMDFLYEELFFDPLDKLMDEPLGALPYMVPLNASPQNGVTRLKPAILDL